MFETSTCFGQAVAALRAYSTAASAKLTLVVHDFGVVPGFAYSNTGGCDKLIVFDVLALEFPGWAVAFVTSLTPLPFAAMP